MALVRYRIADITYEVNGMQNDLSDISGLFMDRENAGPDIMVKMEACNDIQIRPYKPLLNDHIIWAKRDDGGYCLYVQNFETGKIMSCLEVDKYWREPVISYNPDICNEDYALHGPLGEVLFRNRILYKSGIVMHAAAVEWKGHGIVFTAPSGTGKSTQANLWKTHRCARVINGDRPALKFNEGRLMVYGTPWSGAKPEFLNINAPVSAIFVLKQAPENSITLLSPQESLVHLMPRLFLPYYDNEMMDMAAAFLEKIISSTRVYILKCRPDQGAVELVEKCLT
ncbi:MAG TPA: hypothetical protein VF941_04590 [Clostridia bacterium]